MYCKNCGKEIAGGAKFCMSCGVSLEDDYADIDSRTKEKEPSLASTAEEKTSDSNYSDNETENMHRADSAPTIDVNMADNTGNPIMVLNVGRTLYYGKLSVYKDRLEFVFERRKNFEVREVYHYFNIKSVFANKGSILPSLVVETIDNNKMFFSIVSETSFDVYNEKASIINQVKEMSPSLDELGLTKEDMEKELKEDNKKIEHKFAKFFHQYRSFKSLSLINKIVHIAIPAFCLLFFLSMIGGDISSRMSDGAYISCAKTVASDLLKSPSTAQFSDARIVERDDYGRVLVTMTIDSQNSFGAYVRKYFAVVIHSYNDDTGEFYYGGVQTWDNSRWEDIFLENAKEAAGWNEPLEEDN